MIPRQALSLLALVGCALALHAPPGGVPAAASARAPSPALNAFGPRPGERRAAVERILEVELARLQTAVELNVARMSLPKQLQTAAPTSEEIVEEMNARSPMLRWAITRWFIEAAGTEKYGVWSPQLKRLELLPWQWTPKAHPTLTTPTFVESLIHLRPTLEMEVRKGFRTSPLRVCRLLYRSGIVYALAALSFLPGPQRKLIQRTWPRLVEHLATTLELNHVAVLQSGTAEAKGEPGKKLWNEWLDPRNWVEGCSRWINGCSLWLNAAMAGCLAQWTAWRRPKGKLRYAR